MDDKRKIDRRQFLAITWAVSLLAFVGQIGGALFKFLTPKLEKGTFGTKVSVGQINEFDAGSVHFFRGGRFFLVRLDEGFIAMYRKCPHLGCAVPWIEEVGQFICPCHVSVFNKKGEVLSGPSPRPLDYFPIEIKDNELIVDTGQVILRYEFDETQVTPV